MMAKKYYLLLFLLLMVVVAGLVIYQSDSFQIERQTNVTPSNEFMNSDGADVSTELHISNQLNEAVNTRVDDLNDTIKKQNNDILELVAEYDQDLSNEANKQKLSNALLQSDEYRENVLEKFKLEQSLEK